MNAAVWVRVQHVVTGHLSFGEYCAAQGELRIDGHLMPIKSYWAVMQLDKAGMLLPAVLFFLDTVNPLA